jgi:hypothetical protein
MLIETKLIINKLEDYLSSNPEPYDSKNEEYKLIVRAENKLCRKFIRYLESLR